MTFQPDDPFPKGAGDTIRSKDWNDLVQEVQQLRTEIDRLNRLTRGWMRIPFLPYFPPDSNLQVSSRVESSTASGIRVVEFSVLEVRGLGYMLIALPVPPGAIRIHQLRMAGDLGGIPGTLNISLQRTVIDPDRRINAANESLTTPLLDNQEVSRAQRSSQGVALFRPFDQRLPISNGELDAESSALTLVVRLGSSGSSNSILRMNLIAAEFEYGDRA